MIARSGLCAGGEDGDGRRPEPAPAMGTTDQKKPRAFGL